MRPYATPESPVSEPLTYLSSNPRSIKAAGYPKTGTDQKEDQKLEDPTDSGLDNLGSNSKILVSSVNAKGASSVSGRGETARSHRNTPLWVPQEA